MPTKHQKSQRRRSCHDGAAPSHRKTCFPRSPCPERHRPLRLPALDRHIDLGSVATPPSSPEPSRGTKRRKAAGQLLLPLPGLSSWRGRSSERNKPARGHVLQRSQGPPHAKTQQHQPPGEPGRNQATWPKAPEGRSELGLEAGGCCGHRPRPEPPLCRSGAGGSDLSKPLPAEGDRSRGVPLSTMATIHKTGTELFPVQSARCQSGPACPGPAGTSLQNSGHTPLTLLGLSCGQALDGPVLRQLSWPLRRSPASALPVHLFLTQAEPFLPQTPRREEGVGRLFLTDRPRGPFSCPLPC